MPNVTVNEDLTSHVVSDDGTLEFFLPSYNPITTKAFSGPEDVQQFAVTYAATYKNAWQPYVDPEVREQERLNRVMKDKRKERDSLLAASDWTQFNDSPLSNEQKTIWAVYRQALRDITEDPQWPDVTFPETP